VSQSTETLKNDIAFVADLAREGAKPTYAGGEFLLFCGVVFGGASFAVAASLAGYLPVSMNWIWLASMVVFIGFPLPVFAHQRYPQAVPAGLPARRLPSDRTASAAVSTRLNACFSKRGARNVKIHRPKIHHRKAASS